MNYGKEQVLRKRTELSSKRVKIIRKFQTLGFQLAFVAICALATSGIGAAYGVYQGILDSAPDIQDIDATPTGYLSTVLDSDENITATLVASGSNRIYVAIDEIPLNLQNAFIAIEDSRFREHNGIDLQGIIRAAVVGISSGDFSGTQIWVPECINDQQIGYIGVSAILVNETELIGLNVSAVRIYA